MLARCLSSAARGGLGPRGGLLRASAPALSKKVAMVLSGCGVYDGTEIQEAVFAISALSKAGADVSYFAPDVDQMHVIDHTKGEELNEKRNVLREAARITRGNIGSLSELKAADYDCLVVPGGFGAAKNLSDLAVKGGDVTVHPDMDRVIKDFHTSKKAQGFCCIAPALAAKSIGNGVEVTLGSDQESDEWPYAGTCGAVTAVGAKHVVRALNEVHVDAANKVVSSPAYMKNGKPHEIEESVAGMVRETLKLA